MARINIEECWWSDPRRMKLAIALGGGALADGSAVNMWRLAQEFWSKGRRLIPKDLFDTLGFASDLLGVCLAEVRGDMVYVRGSSAYLDWAAEKREAAKIGGKKSAKRPRNAKGQLQKQPKQSPSKTQAESKLIQASDSGSFSGSSSKIEEEGSPPGKISGGLKQEIRFRLAKEIDEIEKNLAVMFDGVVPALIKNQIPEMLFACEGDAKAIHKILEDLYQSPKIRGEGLEGSKASYLIAAISNRFNLLGNAS